MRVVLDTGVLMAALITTNTPPDRIYQAWREGRFELITSDWQLDEFRRVSRYPRLRKFVRHADAGRMVNGLRSQAVVLTDLPWIDVSRDSDDNPILATAVAGGAQYLVSGDKKDLLALRNIGSIRIVSARRFIDILER